MDIKENCTPTSCPELYLNKGVASTTACGQPGNTYRLSKRIQCWVDEGRITVAGAPPTVVIPPNIPTDFDPFDPNDPLLDCSQYEIGQSIIIGNNPMCPDFMYTVFSDGNGGCQMVMMIKPEGISGNTNS